MTESEETTIKSATLLDFIKIVGRPVAPVQSGGDGVRDAGRATAGDEWGVGGVIPQAG